MGTRPQSALPRAATDATPLVRYETFIQAIRDSGYKGSSAALAELIDNAIEADAKNINIDLISSASDDNVSSIRVTDDGVGMTLDVLETALQFGGSSRFNARQGFGRYGMGLPCSSISLAVRVDVWTTRSRGPTWWSYLDVSEISSKGLNAAPKPMQVDDGTGQRLTKGTKIELSQCDRLDPANRTAVAKLLHAELGRMFRHVIKQGVRITIDGTPIVPIDPLFRFGDPAWSKGRPFGPPLKFPIKVPHSRATSEVTVTFTELPVAKWFDLPNKIKRQLNIATGAGVSVVRAGREVDYGWFFMGKKRRENYDDWWRCEIQYEPDLDELFGLTHTKQRVRPTDALSEIISPDIESIARTLNARVRKAFLGVKTESRITPSERKAMEADVLLNPPALFVRSREESMRASYPKMKVVAGLKYSLTHKQVKGGAIFEAFLKGNTVDVHLNTRHVFYEQVYSKIKKERALRSADALRVIELLILAYSRAELSLTSARDVRLAERLRSAWSEVLTSFLG